MASHDYIHVDDSDFHIQPRLLFEFQTCIFSCLLFPFSLSLLIESPNFIIPSNTFKLGSLKWLPVLENSLSQARTLDIVWGTFSFTTSPCLCQSNVQPHDSLISPKSILSSHINPPPPNASCYFFLLELLH